MSYKWKVPATIDAVNALGEHHKDINETVLIRAEQLALERSKVDGYDAAITSADVLSAIEEKKTICIDCGKEIEAGKGTFAKKVNGFLCEMCLDDNTDLL